MKIRSEYGERSTPNWHHRICKDYFIW